MKLIFDNFKPDIILNFAAYTKVDLAEIEIDRKILADLAMNDIETFAAIAKEAKSQLAA